MTAHDSVVDAVPMADLSRVLDLHPDRLRFLVKRGKLPGAFQEYSFPRSARARWMFPIEDARMIAEGFGHDAEVFADFVVSVRPAEAA